jgi:hypothetical protein
MTLWVNVSIIGASLPDSFQGIEVSITNMDFCQLLASRRAVYESKAAILSLSSLLQKQPSTTIGCKRPVRFVFVAK